MRTAFKIILSGWIILHLTVVVIAPNPESVLYRSAESLIASYGNFLGLNTTWRFFSPNPRLQTVFYEAVAYAANGDVLTHEEHRFPERDVDVMTREGMNRMMAAAMIVSSRDDLVNSLLKPYLCRRHPTADEIYVYQMHNSLPGIDKARILGGDRDGLTTTERNIIATLKCKMAETP